MKVQLDNSEQILDIYFRYKWATHAHAKVQRPKVTTTVVIQTLDKTILATAEVTNNYHEPFERVKGRRYALLKAYESANFSHQQKSAIGRALTKKGMKL